MTFQEWLKKKECKGIKYDVSLGVDCYLIDEEYLSEQKAFDLYLNEESHKDIEKSTLLSIPNTKPKDLLIVRVPMQAEKEEFDNYKNGLESILNGIYTIIVISERFNERKETAFEIVKY